MEPMLCPVLIGRDAELGGLTSALDAAGHGHGSTVFVRGDPGVGKSRLAREATTAAAARGYFVLAGRATESALPMPFRPVTEALMGAARAGLVPDGPALANYRPALGTLIPEWRRPGDGDAEVSPVIVGEALLRLLCQPGRAGALLVLEDLHWADPETVAIVEYLADNTARVSATCLVTMRNTPPSPARELLCSLNARRTATAIDVPRLDPTAVSQMAAACLGVTSVPPAVVRLLANCDGLPFAVEELLAAAVASGELVRGPDGWLVNPDIVTGVPSSIIGSVRGRITALGGEARRVIVSAAVLGRQFDWRLLPNVADVAEPEVLDALHQAHEVQLIEPVSDEPGTFRFRHALTRHAILSDLLPPERASRSRRAATAVEQAHPGLPDAWCELAAGLRAAAGQLLPAARLRLTAGRRGLQQGALTSALDALHDAQKLLAESAESDVELGFDIDEALGEALAQSGDYEQLGRLVEDVLARVGADDLRREALIRVRAANAVAEDDARAAAAHLAAARAIARRLPELELASRVDAASARYALAAGEHHRAEELARRSLRAAEAAGLTGWAAEVGIESLHVLGHRERMRDPAAARAVFQRAYEIACRQTLGVWQIRSLHELATTDMVADGQSTALLAVRERAHECGLLPITTMVDLQLANLWSLGPKPDLDLAVAAARQAEDGARRIAARRIEAMAICLRAVVCGITGDADVAEQAARRAEALLPGNPEVLSMSTGQVRVLTALFRDDIAGAVRYSATAGRYAAQVLSPPRRARRLSSPAQAAVTGSALWWGLSALLQAVSGGAGVEAIEQAEAAGAAGWNRGCLAYAGAVLAGRAGQPERATSLAAEGASWFAPYAPWWNHLAQRLVARAALDDGWGEPVLWMRQAAAGFEASGHTQLASACRGVLRQAGQRVPRTGRGAAQVPTQLRAMGVTSREMDVYLLVARGYSNADIASRLLISAKTVETHIASLAAKTGQAGRRELVAHAARYADVGTLCYR